MKRKVLFLTDAEIKHLRMMVDYWTISPELYEMDQNGAEARVNGQVTAKINDAPTITADQLDNIYTAIGNSIDADCDAVLLLGGLRSAKATRSAWERIYDAFYALTDSFNIKGSL